MLRALVLLLGLLPSLCWAQVNSLFFTGAPQPIVDCNFAAGASFNAAANTIAAGPLCPPVLFNRGSPKYDFNAAGVLTTYPIDTPDVPAYQPGTHYALGLSIEGGSIFFNKYARDLTQNAWVKSGLTAALTQTGIDGAANAASLLTATAANGTACQTPAGASYQHIVSVFIKAVRVSGEIDVSQDCVNWTNITSSLTSNGYVRVPAGGLYATPAPGAVGIGLRIGTVADEIAVDYANSEGDQNNANVAPTTPLLETNNSLIRSQDNAWINLAAVSGWNPDSWTIVVREMIPTWIVPEGAQGSGGRTILQVDDGAGQNAYTLQNEQDNTTDNSCNGVANLLHCPDWALIPWQIPSQPTGKVRATALPGNQLLGLAPPGAGLFSVVAITYDRNLGDAITVNTGGPPTTLSDGQYFPAGRMPVLSASVSPQFATRIFKRLVLGGAPLEATTVSGTATAGDVLTITAAWEHPQTTAQSASPSYTVQAGDTTASMAVGLAAAVNVNSTMAASGIGAVASGAAVYLVHSGALFVSLGPSVSGAATETLTHTARISNLGGYIQQVQIYGVALRQGDLMQALLPTSPISVSPNYLLLEGGGSLLLEGDAGKLECEGSC